jgi:hypothetical protein
MKLHLGTTDDGKPFHLTDDDCYRSHTESIGGTQTGKTNLMDLRFRQSVIEGMGVASLEKHGQSFQNNLRWLALNRVGLDLDTRPVVIIDPSQSDYIYPLNFFDNPHGDDIETLVSRRTSATAKVWGSADTDKMPTFERICGTLFHYTIESGESLANTIQLLHYPNRHLRGRAIAITSSRYRREQWQWLQSLNEREWNDRVESTANRLARFVAPRAVRRFTSLKQGFDFVDFMDRGGVMLVNLSASGELAAEYADVFGVLLLLKFAESAMARIRARRPGQPPPKVFPLFLDEFASFASPDLARMLAETLKGGLHLVCGYQSLDQVEAVPQLAASLSSNARHRFIFAPSFEDALRIVPRTHLTQLNTREIKQRYYRTTHLYEEETRTIEGYGDSWNSGHGAGLTGPEDGWPNERNLYETDTKTHGGSVTSTTMPFLKPVAQQELASEVEWSPEEKRLRLAELLTSQPLGHCFAKKDREPVVGLKVFEARNTLISEKWLLDYKRALANKTGTPTATEADRLIAADESRFNQLAASREVADDDPSGWEPETPFRRRRPKPQ